MTNARCEHQRQGGLPCATPGCPAGSGGDFLVVPMRTGRAISSAAELFGKIYIGPDGVPVHGFPAMTKVIYERRHESDNGWLFVEHHREEVPAVTAEEECRRRWDEIKGTCDDKLATVAANKERLIEAWIAETGLKPSESLLVQQDHGDGRTTFHVERRHKPHSSPCPACTIALDPTCQIGVPFPCIHCGTKVVSDGETFSRA